MSDIKIAFGSDHRGFALKATLIKYALEKGYEVKDFGPDNADSCDYVDFARAAAEASGIGMSIAANKVPGVRAALVFNRWMTEMTRRHNDANVLCISGDQTAPALAENMLEIFLTTEFEGGRHVRRVGKIKDIEGDYTGK